MAQSFVFRSPKNVCLTWCDNRDSTRKYGYALRGVTPMCKCLLARGQRINAIAAIGAEGVLATELMTGTVNGDRFIDFLRATV